MKATLSNNVRSGSFYSIRGVTILAGFLSCQFKYDIKPFKTILSYPALLMTKFTFSVIINYIDMSDCPITYLVFALFRPILDQCKLYLTQWCFMGILFFFLFSCFINLFTEFWNLWFYVPLIKSLVLL